MILKSSQKTCSLDRISTSLFVECFDQLLSAVTAIINQSLQTGVFHSVFKEAIVIPFLKNKQNHLTRTIWKTIGPSPIFLTCQKSLKKSSSLSFLLTSMLISFSPYLSPPTAQDIVLKQPFSSWWMTFFMLWTMVMSLFQLFLIFQLRLTPLITTDPYKDLNTSLGFFLVNLSSVSDPTFRTELRQ